MRRWGALAGLIAAMACGCTGGHNSATPSGSGSVSVSVRPIPIPPGVPVIGVRHPKRIVLHPGEQRAIRLVPSDLGNWRPLTTDNPGVLSMKQAGGYPTVAELTALIRARRAGTANIFTETDDACLHSKQYPCGMPQMVWTLKVKIVRR
jgi:hypothetical protein